MGDGSAFVVPFLEYYGADAQALSAVPGSANNQDAEANEESATSTSRWDAEW